MVATPIRGKTAFVKRGNDGQGTDYSQTLFGRRKVKEVFDFADLGSSQS